jgi:hypothetical protein
VLALHECVAWPFHAAVDPIAAQSIAEPLHSAVEPLHSAVEPLHSAADPTGAGAALTETSCICVWV